jgi:hypothetical protein
MTAEGVPLGFNIRAYREVAINLAIVADDVTPISRMHRLMTRGGQIDNCKTPMDEGNAGRHVNPDIVAVRAAVLQTDVHRFGDGIHLIR